MELQEHLRTFTRDNAMTEINRMLPEAEVSISWWGKRMVSINGYKGSVALNELAKKFLNAEPLHRDTWATVQERLKCADLWARLLKLYGMADEQLAQSWFYDLIERIKAVFIRVFELDTTRAQMQMPYEGKRLALNEFRREQFQAIWPEEKIPRPIMPEKSFMDVFIDLVWYQRIEPPQRVHNLRYDASFSMMLEAAAKEAAAKEAAAKEAAAKEAAAV